MTQKKQKTEQHHNALPLVGWREKVALPEWGITQLRAKIDTGARTSSLHVANLVWLDEVRVRFEVVISEKPQRRTQWVEAVPIRESLVKPSTGIRQRRVVCRTMFRIGATLFEADVSLVCRKGMLCRMLVGRTALHGRFVVDPAQKYLQSVGFRNKLETDSIQEI